MKCKKSWLFQEVPESVSRGLYDYLKGVVVIPPNEAWILSFVSDAWQETKSEDVISMSEELEPNTIQLHLTMINSVSRCCSIREVESEMENSR